MGVMPQELSQVPHDGRTLRTFLIADIRGYSTFTRQRGDEAAARLAKVFADLARDTAEARSGSVIELRGDEALAVFESTPQALRAALEFQCACAEETAATPELPLPVGIGIDCGEAIPVEDGFRGVALNMAARLCSKAAAGQVLVTKGVAEMVHGLEDVTFEPYGAVALKGFDQPVEAFVAVSTRASNIALAESRVSDEPLPPELDEPTPLVDRERELTWLRGTWRQAQRGNGRVVFVSGQAGIGKTRLAGETAAHVQMTGGVVRYAGSGGAGGGEALAAIGEARSVTAPTLYILDQLNLYENAIATLADSVEVIESRPALFVGLFREAEGGRGLAELVDRIDVRGDGHRTLGPLGLDGVAAIARSYVRDVGDLPTESMLRASGGVPARVHEVVGEWARDEAKRRLAAAAEWLSAGKGKQAAGLEFANNVIALKLERVYAAQAAGRLSDLCPYKGLAAFDQSDAPYFYGRERLVGELAARTVGMGLLGVVGPSGSGKSSLVMAGLLPSLASGLLPGSERWGHATLRPGEHPAGELERALASCDPAERLVLVVDQLEEVFTTTTDESERAAFIDRIVELARDSERSVVVVTIRADYTGHCAPYDELAALFSSNLVLVGPMGSEELRRAVELPARRVGLRVESALADALVEEVGDEPGGLPLLSTALVELWRARDDRWLRLEAYQRTGGVRGAVARLAEASYWQLSEPERNAASTVLLRLVSEGEGGSDIRRRVPVAEFDGDRDPAVASVLGRLTEDRLLTRDDDMIEIAHEALIREWPRLRSWLDEDAAGRQLRGHLTQASKQWSERDRDAGELYRGARLSATLDWAQAHDRGLNALEREFLAQSSHASEREAETQRRTNRRLRGLLAGTAIFLAVALVAGLLALVQRGRARSAQAAAEAQALRSDAERIGTLALTEANLDRSLLLAVAGVKLARLPETFGDLLAVLQEHPAALHLVRPSRTEVSLAVSPDGRLVAAGDSGGVVHWVDLRTWESSGPAVHLGAPVSSRAIAFSPDGRQLAVATTTRRRSTLNIVDMPSRTARSIGSWPSIPSQVGPLRFTRLAFSPDGSRIAVTVATASASSPVPVAAHLFLLDAPSGRVVWRRRYPLRPGQQEPEVAFTPRGELVTSASQGDTVVWSARTGRIVRRFPIGGPMSLSPNGRIVALAQNNADPADPSSSLAVLDLRTGKHRSLAALPVKAWITSVAFTPDGNSIVGRSFDGGVRVWDVVSGSIVQTFTAQGSGLDVAVVPNGGTALSGAGDGSVVAWDLSGRQRLARTFRWNTRQMGCAETPCNVINSQSTLMATDQADGTVALIDIRTLKLIATLPARNGLIANALAFFPDGRTLATGGINGHVTLWDVRTRSVVRTLHFSDPVWWVAVNAEGELMAVETQAKNSPDSRVQVLDVRTGKVLYTHTVRYGRGGLYFSPNGRALAALGCCQPASSINVWDAQSGADQYTPHLHGHATSIAFSPDGLLLGAGTEDGHVVLWDARNGKQLGSPIKVATGAIDPISFSPNGRLLAAASGDQTTTLWDVASRKRLGNSFPVEQGVVTVPVFEPNGNLMIDYLSDAAEWPTDLQTLERFACRAAGRDLTAAEWNDLLPRLPYRRVCPQ